MVLSVEACHILAEDLALILKTIDSLLDRFEALLLRIGHWLKPSLIVSGNILFYFIGRDVHAMQVDVRRYFVRVLDSL